MSEALQRRVLQYYSVILFVTSLVYTFYHTFPTDVRFWFVLFAALTPIILILLSKALVIRFVLSLFTALIAWRIGALYHMADWLDWLYIGFLVLKVLYFFSLAYRDLHGQRMFESFPVHAMTCYEWQLLFVRMYIGFDLVPHFTEKLFAGSVRMADVTDFAKMGLDSPLLFVIIAGLIEFSAALAISIGFLMRTTCICFVIYLMTASLLGNHFELGFIWASPGGGWEYPVLWSILVLSFAFFSPYKFSLDMYFLNHYKVPKYIKALMGRFQRMEDVL